MADPKQDIDELLEAYFDGDLDELDRQRVEQLIAGQPELADRVALRGRVDESLRRIGAPPPADTSFLDTVPESLGAIDEQSGGASHQDRLLPREDSESGASLPRSVGGRGRRLAYAAIAAAAAWLLVGGLYFVGRDSQRIVAYEPRPLAEVYEECVGEGFEPYWVCDDDELFAATFERRQGVPLQLDELPEDRQMVGLSYLAGISRKSTSLLAMVDDTPVIVFVDRVDRDWSPRIGPDPPSGLFVKRVEKHGLVFYEVSPFEDVYFVNFFSTRAKT